MKTICLYLAVVFLLFATDAHSLEHFFSATPNILVPSIYSACSGDFNGDGNVDIATAGTDSMVSILTGLGDGTFDSPVSFNVGKKIRSVYTDDFNWDGDPDLVLLSDSSVSILTGAGDGTFASPVSYYTGVFPVEICTGDFNEDGHPDIVVANLGNYPMAGMLPGDSPSNISILLNMGDGTFSSSSFSSGDCIIGVHAGHFDSDGHLDLVVVNSGYALYPDMTWVTGSISVLIGDGDGTFAALETYDEGMDPSKVSSGDFNGDGHNDLVVSNQNSDNVTVLMGAGTGLFYKMYDYAVGDGPQEVYVRDMNNDGNEDLIVLNKNGYGTMSVLLGEGLFAFSPAATYSFGGTPASICSGDFNDDGQTDLAVAILQDAVAIMFGNGGGTLETTPSYRVDNLPEDVCSADFDEDGNIDLAVVGPNGTYQLSFSILRGLGSGEFAPAARKVIYERSTSICSGDFNEDGHGDLICTISYDDKIIVMIGDGNGEFATPVSYDVLGGPVSPITSDFNRDGHLDLAFANYASDYVAVLFGMGEGTFAPPVYYETEDHGYPKRVIAGDFNDDGFADIAVSKNYYNISIMLNEGDGTFAPPVAYYACKRPDDMVLADFNEDGHIDLAVTNRYDEYSPYTHNVSILCGAGDGTFASPTFHGIAYDPTSICSGDFDKDGHEDLAVANRTIGSVSLLRGSGVDRAEWGVYAPQ